jgi:subfamily B ATP-binding cassette protein HlyB/CyaB
MRTAANASSSSPSATPSASCCKTPLQRQPAPSSNPWTSSPPTGPANSSSSPAAPSLAGELAKFDFSWFIPSLVKYRKLLGEVLLLISFILQLFALVSPLFFQVVMDKVLVHRGMTTLDVLVIGLLVVVVFESLLNGLRSYIFSHTTNRIDVELGARLFRHLVQLPLAYFQTRRVGDSVARVRELENIRSFLTGNALTVLLDVVFSIVFIAVMLFYSVPLTLIVLVSMPLYFGLSLAVVPILRRRLDEKFARGAENQAMLVETVSAIQTVKATALEPAFGRRWDNQLAAYVSASFRTQNLASCAHEGVNLIGKLVNAATLWYGAHLVMEQRHDRRPVRRLQHVRAARVATHHAHGPAVDRLPADRHLDGPPGRHPEHPHRSPA